ncbi:MAG: hypothetical protein CEN89_454 [Candidatus Berkelbacteria bacterium Licking1014_7]|uniref:General secretion pathway protein GspG n=1 Tax=Candidatus Berkelbacteria bacterium Licking1014_7 TaxID=2017147 RepID=A0A554LIR5_9BACT|nr:MAG: hypothetical protein CEN89_454 [Candidatus Berkelbacteria bacterium Licking1014_7]
MKKGFTPFRNIQTIMAKFFKVGRVDSRLNLSQKSNKFLTGFTLLEILLVVAIISILSVVIVVSVNPARQFKNSRNSQRKADVHKILNGVYNYYVDNNAFPSTITTTSTEICKTGSSVCAGLVVLDDLTATQTYLIEIPIDPLGGINENGVGYKIYKNANNRIFISATRAEDETIEISI